MSETNGESAVRRFSAKLKKIKFEVEQEDDSILAYELRELRGPQREELLDKMSQRIKIGPDGRPAGMGSIKGMHGDLLGMCIFCADGSQASRSDIEKWPSSLQGELFTLAQELSGIGEKAKETAKNV